MFVPPIGAFDPWQVTYGNLSKDSVATCIYWCVHRMLPAKLGYHESYHESFPVLRGGWAVKLFTLIFETLGIMYIKLDSTRSDPGRVR